MWVDGAGSEFRELSLTSDDEQRNWVVVPRVLKRCKDPQWEAARDRRLKKYEEELGRWVMERLFVTPVEDSLW